MTRRGLLVGLASGLVIHGAARAQTPTGGEVRLNAWVRIASDNSVTIQLSQSEMGQGIATTLPVALADELGADWNSVRTEWSPFDPAYRHPQYDFMFTGNSESSSTFYPIMRVMGAAAREMLVRAAATSMGAEAATLEVVHSTIRDPASEKSVRFGDVAADAARLPVPEKPALRPDAALTLIGKAQRRWDIPGKVDGSAVFGIDVKVPGMAIAAIKRSPAPGGKLVSYDRDGILARKGVVAAVEIASGLAVVADRYWTARKALEEGALVFAPGPLASYTTERQRADHHDRLKSGDFIEKKTRGDAAGALRQASKVVEAVYESQVLAHATMEPMNCTAHVTAARCEIWAPTQAMEITHNVARQITGLPDDAVVIHRTFLGGGFGRRLMADFVRIAVEVSKAAGRPVKVIWHREEDIAYDGFRAPMTHEIRATLGADGKPAAMTHRVVSPTHFLYVFPRTKMKVDVPWDQPIVPPHAYDSMAVEGVVEPVYDIANYHVAQNFVDTPLSVSVLRTTGHGPNHFALESFIDELAHIAGKDPLIYRLSLTGKDPRATAVLRAVAELSGWDKPVPKGAARGIALAKAFNGYIAQVVEIEVRGTEIKTSRVWSTVDVGTTLDPGIAASNIEGGIVWGLSSLRNEITFAAGAAQEVNFDTYEPLHLFETPSMTTRFLVSGGPIGGTGELGPVPTQAAFCNAVFAATGTRIRSLPISRHGFTLS